MDSKIIYALEREFKKVMDQILNHSKALRSAIIDKDVGDINSEKIFIAEKIEELKEIIKNLEANLKS